MGKEILKGTVPFDRNIARTELFTEQDDRDAWRVVIHMQDALYNGGTRVTAPEFGTERIEFTFSEIKGTVFPNGKTGQQMLEDLRGCLYFLRERKLEERAAAEQARAAQQEATDAGDSTQPV